MPLRRRAKDAPAAPVAAAATQAKTPPSSPSRAKKDASSVSPRKSAKKAVNSATTGLDPNLDLLHDRQQRRNHRRLLTALAVLVTLAATTYALWQQNKALRAALSPLAQLARETELFGGGLSAWEAMRDGVSDALRTGPLGAGSTAVSSSPGAAAAAAGLGPHHPVIIIPSFVTSSLELWSGPSCASKYFRSRFWVGLSMTTRLLGDKRCWLETMALDEKTGLDPVVSRDDYDEEEEEEEREEAEKEESNDNGVDGDGGEEKKPKRKKKNKRKRTTRLRAVEGLAGVDYFMPGTSLIFFFSFRSRKKGREKGSKAIENARRKEETHHS